MGWRRISGLYQSLHCRTQSAERADRVGSDLQTVHVRYQVHHNAGGILDNTQKPYTPTRPRHNSRPYCIYLFQNQILQQHSISGIIAVTWNLYSQWCFRCYHTYRYYSRFYLPQQSCYNSVDRVLVVHSGVIISAHRFINDVVVSFFCSDFRLSLRSFWYYLPLSR